MKNIFPQREKKMVYSIRSLKNGTGSVLIGASFILLALATPHVAADENLSSTRENVSAVAVNSADTDSMPTPIPVSGQNNENDSLKTEEKAKESEVALTTESAKAESATTNPSSDQVEKKDDPATTSEDKKTEVAASPVSDEKTKVETNSETPIAENYFRIHVKKLPEETKDSQGLWTWDDVEKPSENWPSRKTI